MMDASTGPGSCTGFASSLESPPLKRYFRYLDLSIGRATIYTNRIAV
jgi:hypothetical protein